MKNKDFITGKVPITKEEVRAISLNKLELLNAKTFIFQMFLHLKNICNIFVLQYQVLHL